MFNRIRKRMRKEIQVPVEDLNRPLAGKGLTESLGHNESLIRELFTDVDTMLVRRFHNSREDGLDFCIFFTDGVTDSLLINEHIIKPLLLAERLHPGPGLLAQVRDELMQINDIGETDALSEIVEAVTYGDTLLLVEGSSRALILSTKSFPLRSINEPESEKVLSGPREGFTEGIMTNLSMIRRRMRTNQLKIRFQSVGKQTGTSVCVCYMDNIVNKSILGELYRRLNAIDIDSVLDANYILEHIREKSLLGYSTVGFTERPDIAVAKLLEGRIAILVDGSPVVLTAPYLMIENFQSNEDYYVNSVYATFSRVLRMVGFLLSILTPAIYLAVVAYHHEILPASLMINITTERQNVPLPASIECFVMLIVFDVLRETGVRTPSQMGQALSIVGALVIGQSAVEASLVAAPMIIVVAFTGITNLLTPKLSSASLIARYFLLLLACNFGLLGVVVGLSLELVHILNLVSFGVPSLMPTEHLGYQQIKDTVFRSAWPNMLTRTPPIATNVTRATTRDKRDESKQ